MSQNLIPSAYVALFGSRNTRAWYANCLKRYLEIVTDMRMGTDQVDDAWMAYASGGADLRRDLIMFPAKCRGQLAPMTIHQYMCAAEQYLADVYGIELSRQERRLRKRAEPDNNPITINAEITREMIAELLRYADERLGAEILMAVSGGLRIGEIVRLERSDISINADPVEVNVRREISKNKTARTTYISTEAANALRAYYNVRDDVCRAGRIADIGARAVNSPNVFPFQEATEIRRLRLVVEKSKLGMRDSATNRMNIHFHLFRAWFSTQAGLAGAPKDYIEDLMGHVGYLRTAYWKPISEKKREIYKTTIEPYVTINVPDDYYDLKVRQGKELDELRAANLRNQQMIALMAAQLNDLQRAQMTGTQTVGPVMFQGGPGDEDIGD